jgi:hypothetical protein
MFLRLMSNYFNSNKNSAAKITKRAPQLNAQFDLFQNPMENGIYMLVIRFTYFAFLAEGIASIWIR